MPLIYDDYKKITISLRVGKRDVNIREDKITDKCLAQEEKSS